MDSKEKTFDVALPKVTAKTTRSQLLDAYNKALEALGQRIPEKSVEMKQLREKEVTVKASEYSVEAIIKGLADFQIGIVKSFNDLTDKMIAESNKLTELREASMIETAKLNELYEIQSNVNTLTALINAQNERKESFDREMAEKKKSFENEIHVLREEWKKEQQEHEISVKERDDLLKKQHQREEEEYKYRLMIERRKEADDYEAKKILLTNELVAKKLQTEKELSEKRNILTEQEQEVAALRKRVDAIPSEMEEAVKKAENAVRAAMKQQFDFETKLSGKEIDAEKKLNALKISNLEEVITKLQAQISDLTKQLQISTKQVQEMAVKAIESSSGIKSRSSAESTTEQQKISGKI